ncbi:hypothetical protein [Sneathia sanguinegens]|uniref:hypothetical protein n=1 Tax=Sneathia sanguinegens TaxID=40543 RepID=UPI00258E00A0|nr:hypothetical protein [Sneathia sanguinegens]MDU4652142.1 hypothetical protein [Sneathia sanguinegens]
MENIQLHEKYVDVKIVPINEDYVVVEILKNEVFNKSEKFELKSEKFELIINNCESENLIDDFETLILGKRPFILKREFIVDILKEIIKLNEIIEQKLGIEKIERNGVEYVNVKDILKFLGKPIIENKVIGNLKTKQKYVPINKIVELNKIL